MKSILLQAHDGQPNLIDTSALTENKFEQKSTNIKDYEKSVFAEMTSVGDFEGCVVETDAGVLDVGLDTQLGALFEGVDR